jgi:hypothetical protein
MIASPLEDVLALLDVGAFEAHHQRHLQIDFARGGHDALGDDVAAHDAAEDVDENAFDRRVGKDDLEGGGDLLLRSAAADVAEIGRLAALSLMMSIVAIARPAPLTMQPILPSSLM